MKKIRVAGTACAMAFLMVLAGCSKTAETSGAASVDTTPSDTTVVTSGSTSAEASVSEETSAVQKITVYTASEEKKGEGTYITPGIRLGDAEITDVNSEISKFVAEIKEDSDWFSGTEYSFYDGGSYVSLLVRGISTIDCDSYKAFNVSAATGKLMSDEELLAAAGQDSAGFTGLVKKTVEAAMADDKEGSLFTVVEDMDYRAANLKDSNLAKAAPFVSERGNLCFIYDLKMCVGAEEYTVCLDTVTHEHMLNDFGNWTLYPEWG